ncbi:MAG: type transport system ATP-binding protein, partial [Thermoleophilaceae bacterium]|nr:type transport system ATP-binding protein [Thermoleophilaceae bacterium]
DDPTELLHRLTGEALERGESVQGLTVTRPSLEDVYLELTAETESAAVTPEAAPAASRT